METAGRNNLQYDRVFSDGTIAKIADNPFYTHCVHCGKVGWTKTTLKLCSRCKSVSYCSRECQIADYSFHKTRCKDLSKLKGELEERVVKLHQNHMDDSMGSLLDLFFSKRFSAFAHDEFVALSSAYLGNRCNLTNKLLDEAKGRLDQNFRGQINELALQAALEQKLDISTIVCLCQGRFDRHHFDGIAGMMIALGKYQQAYDFLKFWLSSESEFYANHLETISMIQLQDQDVLEPLSEIKISKNCDISRLLEMALLKLCVYSNVCGAQLLARKFGFNDDIVAVIGSFLNVPKNWQVADTGSLELQARQLLSMAHGKNKCILHCLAHLNATVRFTKKTTPETRKALQKAGQIFPPLLFALHRNKFARKFLAKFVEDIDIDFLLVPADDLLE